MKTQIHIAIDIDTDKDGKTHTDVGANIVDMVKVRNDLSRKFALGDESVLAATLHEIGHVIAKRLGLPAAQKDPRMSGGDFSAVMSRPDDVMASEVEAWDVAEKIFARTREIALNSYRRGLPFTWYPAPVEPFTKSVQPEAK